MSFQLPDEASPTALTSWYQDVLPELPGLQADLAVHVIRNQLIDFCERSRILTKDVTAALVIGQAEYAVLPSADGLTEIVAPVSLKNNGIAMKPTSADTLNDSGDWESLVGTPREWFRSDFATLRLVPFPSVANPSTTLVSGIGPGDLSATVADASDLPVPGANQFFIVEATNGAGDTEVIKVTASASNVLTLVRAQEGTTALTFLADDPITLRTLKAKIAVRPTLTAASINAAFFREYRMQIAAGAKSALMLMPGKPWTDKTMGVFYRGQFEQAIDRARIQAFKSLGNLSSRVKPRVFGE